MTLRTTTINLLQWKELGDLNIQYQAGISSTKAIVMLKFSDGSTSPSILQINNTQHITHGTKKYSVTLSEVQMNATWRFIKISVEDNNTTPTWCSIYFKSVPKKATIYIDTIKFGLQTNCMHTRTLPGFHKIKMTIDGYEPFETSVEVLPSHTIHNPLKISHNFLYPSDISTPQISGKIQCITQPAGAIIYLNGKKQNATTPTTLTNLPQNRYSITFKKAGYHDYITSPLTVSNNTAQLQTVHARLTVAKSPTLTISTTKNTTTTIKDQIIIKGKLTDENNIGISNANINFVNVKTLTSYTPLMQNGIQLKTRTSQTGTFRVTFPAKIIGQEDHILKTKIAAQTTIVSQNNRKVQSFPIEITVDDRLTKARCTSSPVGADIYIDNKKTGMKTPYIFQINTGLHTFTFKKQSFLPFTKSEILVFGKQNEIFALMTEHGKTKPKIQPNYPNLK